MPFLTHRPRDAQTKDAWPSLEGSEFTDTYTDALAKIIEAKREEKPDRPLDLAAQLCEDVGGVLVVAA
ncbi:hypothetical protein SAMN05446589_8997 [Streptomyces sp. OV198]|uniref:hypothetical protein n=1 Tax=Streptomyces sp. OV198 TaxID=1882787 RepID=UPI000BD4556D|nr:hypothetical protein [Streptomyces sp. OV198]SOE79898.1 hypothetical protein SAMN05446589_8997 [Streptomyces sp. OV198]